MGRLRSGKDFLMQTERSRRFAALALGAAAIFDVTGAVIYRVMRAGLPPPPPLEREPGPFQQAAAELSGAHREAIIRAQAKDGVSLPA